RTMTRRLLRRSRLEDSLRPKVSPLVLMLAFIQIGLSSVGGAAVPLRHILVVRRKWLSDAEFAEEFSIAQALPGASAANVAVMLVLAGTGLVLEVLRRRATPGTT